MNAHHSLEDKLSAMTDHLFKGQYSLNRRDTNVDNETQALFNLIIRLNDTLVEVEPSAKFTEQLRAELMGNDRGLVARVRHLPPRVQIAAGTLAFAGFLLILRRRLGFGGDWSGAGEVPEAVANQ